MNYLSHYFIDHIPGNDYFNAGLLLPDITRGYVKTFKPDLTEGTSGELVELHSGCIRHYESDAKFHASSFFSSYKDIVSSYLNHAGLSDAVQRKWFIAHILFELMVDRVIVKAYPQITNGFYNSLSAISDSSLFRFLEIYGVSAPGGFMEHFNHFREVRYIYYYADTTKFVYSLNRIMLRAGVPEMNERDRSLTEKMILELENAYFSDAEKITKELKQVFA